MHLTADEFIGGWIGGFTSGFLKYRWDHPFVIVYKFFSFCICSAAALVIFGHMRKSLINRSQKQKYAIVSHRVCGLIVGHPLDTIKVRQQNLGTSLFVSIRRTFKYEGIKGFYKGLLFPLINIGPSNAVFFGIYGNTMKLIQDETEIHHISLNNMANIQKVFIAGAVAGVFQVLCTCPVELVKTVLQSKTGGKGSWKKHYEVTYTGPWSAFKGILKERGLTGLYRGAFPMMLRDVPTSGLYTVTYEMLLYSYWADSNMPEMMKQMLAGGIAGIVSWVLVIPLDVVKSRIQADNPSNPLYRGTMDCFIKSYKMGGLAVFGKGLPAIILRAFPVNAAIFAGYESTYELLRNDSSCSPQKSCVSK